MCDDELECLVGMSIYMTSWNVNSTCTAYVRNMKKVEYLEKEESYKNSTKVVK